MVLSHLQLLHLAFGYCGEKKLMEAAAERVRSVSPWKIKELAKKVIEISASGAKYRIQPGSKIGSVYGRALKNHGKVGGVYI